MDQIEGLIMETWGWIRDSFCENEDLVIQGETNKAIFESEYST